MKQLILAEKPSVARDLSQILGATEKHKDYFEGEDVIVTWALGHLLGLKMPEDLNKDWQKWQLETLPMLPKFIGTKPLPKTRHQLQAIERLAKRSDVKEAVIATDAGREGELVARWILQYVRFNKPVKRLWISSQTTKAVREGFAKLKPASDYDDLYQSALARATADWLVGLNVDACLDREISGQFVGRARADADFGLGFEAGRQDFKLHSAKILSDCVERVESKGTDGTKKSLRLKEQRSSAKNRFGT